MGLFSKNKERKNRKNWLSMYEWTIKLFSLYSIRYIGKFECRDLL